MLRLYLLAGLALVPATTAAPAQQARHARQDALFELRIYYPEKGKLAALNARFRDHTMTLFAKHGMRNVAYWNEEPTEAAPEGRLVYILSYADRTSRDASWKAFGADPAWRAVVASSEADGKIVAKVESIFMTATDYSPAVLTAARDGRERATPR